MFPIQKISHKTINELLPLCETETGLRKFWQNYDGYEVFSQFRKITEQELEHSYLVAKTINKPQTKEMIKEQELKLALILIMNEIYYRYSKLAKELGIELNTANFRDVVLEDFCYRDYSETNNIVLEVWTVRKLVPIK